MIVHMIGNAHLDPVWLWSWQAGSDEAVATFRAAADICDEYPEFVFTRGEAWLYEQVASLAPDLHKRVLDLVERGQWHIVGGQYIQPDCNLITEQAWRRQFARGRHYFEQTFRVRPTVAYNVDSFGHPATLPDLLTDLGYRGYVFHRPRPDQVDLPAQTFCWRGPQGGEVVGFRIVPGYNARTHELEERIRTAVEAANPRIGHALCFYGVGNHGGGPTRESVEWILEHRDAFPDMQLRFSTVDAYFDAVEPFRDELPVVDWELQQVFPGCYSVMHDVKQRQQWTEHLLDQAARTIARFGADTSDRERLEQKVADAWDDALFTSFHDILAGTSIPSAWESVRAMQGRALINAEEVVHTVTRRFARSALPQSAAQQIVVANPDDADWEGWVEAEPNLYFDRWRERWLSDADGTPIPHQLVQPEAHLITNRVLFPLRVPAGSMVQVLVRENEPPDVATPPGTLSASTEELANDDVHVRLAGGGIAQIAFRGRELLGPGGIGLWLRKDSSDTWGQHRDRFDEPVDTELAGGEWTVEENGPLRARVRLDSMLGGSRVRWTFALHRGDPRLYVDLEVVFAERFRILQLPIHFAGPVRGWLDGLAGGSVERTPQPIERPVLGWSRVSLGDLDVALVTNDAWSVSLDEDRWQWTLLRSPKMAWYGGQPEVYTGRDAHTDQCEHAFSFVLHADESLDPADLERAARQRAQRPVVFDRYEGMAVRTARQTWLGQATEVGSA